MGLLEGLPRSGQCVVRVWARGSQRRAAWQAWLLVHYLKLADGGALASRLTRFTAAIAQGVEPAQAAREAFGPLDTLEHRLRTYVGQGRFYDARLALESATDDTRPIPVAQWEATMALGDFLTHVLNHDEAERLLDRAALEAPHSAEVLERQALLAFGRNRRLALSNWPIARWPSTRHGPSRTICEPWRCWQPPAT